MSGNIPSWNNHTIRTALFIASVVLIQCATAAGALAGPPVITSTSASASEVRAGSSVTITIKGMTTEKFSIQPEKYTFFGPNRYGVACMAGAREEDRVISIASGTWSFSCMVVIRPDAPPGTYTSEGLGIIANSVRNENLHIKGAPVSFKVTNPNFQVMVPPVITGTSASATKVKFGDRIMLTVKGTASSDMMIQLAASVHGPNGYQLPCRGQSISVSSGPWSVNCWIDIVRDFRAGMDPPPGAYVAELGVLATSLKVIAIGGTPQTASVKGSPLSFQVLPRK